MNVLSQNSLCLRQFGRYCKLLLVPLIACSGLVTAWLAFSPSNAQAQAAAATAIQQNAPSIVVTHTVGLNASGCAAAQEVDSVPGQHVYFCLAIENTGDAVFTTHLILRTVVQSVIRRETYTLTGYVVEPGEKKELTNEVLINEFGFGPFFRMSAVSIDTPVFVTVTSSAQGVSATAVSSATVHPPPYQLYLPYGARPSVEAQRLR